MGVSRICNGKVVGVGVGKGRRVMGVSRNR